VVDRHRINFNSCYAGVGNQWAGSVYRRDFNWWDAPVAACVHQVMTVANPNTGHQDVPTPAQTSLCLLRAPLAGVLADAMIFIYSRF
jgi:hypothetical protein